MQFMELKQMYLGTLPVGSTSVYKVPTTKSGAILREIILHNIHGTEATNVSILVNNIPIVSSFIPAGESLFVGKDWHLVLKTNDEISITTSRNMVINAIVCGSEVSDQ